MNNVPIAGDAFEVVESLDTARERAESRAESLRNERISAKAGDGKITLSSLASAVSSGKLSGLDLHQLNIILKVDLQVWSLLLEFVQHLVYVKYGTHTWLLLQYVSYIITIVIASPGIKYHSFSVMTRDPLKLSNKPCRCYHKIMSH